MKLKMRSLNTYFFFFSANFLVVSILNLLIEAVMTFQCSTTFIFNNHNTILFGHLLLAQYYLYNLATCQMRFFVLNILLKVQYIFCYDQPQNKQFSFHKFITSIRSTSWPPAKRYYQFPNEIRIYIFRGINARVKGEICFL